LEVLIDTNVLIWLDQDVDSLAPHIRSLLIEKSNRVFVSAASAWEVATKRRKGKLDFSRSAADATQGYGFMELPITFADAELAGSLDWEHSDPFDRMILAQAQLRSLRLITADRLMLSYAPVAIMPAR
jgi:PIN domain nuclease of toxin-antitoxin system